MRKILILLAFVPFLLQAQLQKERRVYYLDCSFSMVDLKIWDEVRDNLKNAIDKVSDETTDLYVIPFAKDGQHHTKLECYQAKASLGGKNFLKSKIDAIKPSTASMTYHSDVIKDFYNNNRVASDGLTYLFMMTDGQNEDKPESLFTDEFSKWKEKYGEKQVYGFYVMLHKSAYNTDLENRIDTIPHFWNVHSADVNIGLALVPKNGVFNKRNEEWLELPISGDASDFDIEASFVDTNAPYTVSETTISGDVLRVKIEAKEGLYLPEKTVLDLRLKCKNGKAMESKFRFWLTDNVKVTCLDKKERTLKINIK